MKWTESPTTIKLVFSYLCYFKQWLKLR